MISPSTNPAKQLRRPLDPPPMRQPPNPLEKEANMTESPFMIVPFSKLVKIPLIVLFLTGFLNERAHGSDEEWIQLFNGKNLSGWQVKIRGEKLGNNYGNTFRVEEGLLTVGYEAYGDFNEKFGHLFYHQPFSHYHLRAEYRFIKEQSKGGPGWAIRNSGFMLHGQDPATMSLDQDFPVSIEAQLLGGLGKGDRTTANVCTPGTHIVMDGRLIKNHCVQSSSQTYHGEQWVSVEAIVKGSESIELRVEGETVFKLKDPQLDPSDPNAKGLIKDNELLIHSGTISVQSESHPIQFRKIELKRLDPTE